jgi:DNA repair exonuclease SbcCD ATPase subunit
MIAATDSHPNRDSTPQVDTHFEHEDMHPTHKAPQQTSPRRTQTTSFFTVDPTSVPMSEEEKENLKILRRLEGELSETMTDLDKKLHRVLAKQEYDYMKCFTMYVKRKERDLKDLVEKLSEKAKHADRVKDERIRQLEDACRKAIANETKMDKQFQDTKAQVRKWKDRAEDLESDQEFMKRKTLEAKRKNKLLKTAITRLQQSGFSSTEGLCPKCHAERPPKEVIQEELDKNPFFITESVSTEVSSQNKGKLSRRQMGLY